MNRKYNLKLDLQFRCNNSTMKFNQFDNNTSDFFMRITNGGNLVDIEKAIVVLAIIKPSGKVSSQFVEVENGLVYADLKPSMKDEIGTYTAQAMLILEDERVVTNVISYEVEEDKIFSLLNDTVEATEEFTLLTDMLSRLSTIEISEEQRVINEAERILSEENRKIEESKRVEAELIRQHEEADRTKYDATRESNENIRKQNESIRLANETNRIDEETKRVEEENKRKLAEEERNANYNFMTEDEERRRIEANAHKEAEVLRVQAETDRVNEEAKRRTTEQARVSAENTRVSNENIRKTNEETRQTNETHRVEAETQRQNRYNSFILEAEANASNFENYTNSAKVKEEERKSNELDRKSQEARRVSNEVERISNENTRKANEKAREKNETSRQYVFENKVNEVDKKIVELNTTKDNFVSNINTKVDNKISEIDNVKDNFVSSISTKVDNKISELDSAKSDMTNTVSNKVNEVENRFNALTSKQQQDAEVIDARDGEISLKARLDRDIEKAKQVYVNVEGSHISTDSSVGYLKDVEILGNTIQSASNLADIRSVGDKVEGQELYEIPVLSVGKNLFNTVFKDALNNINGVTVNDSGVVTINGTLSTHAMFNVVIPKGKYRTTTFSDSRMALHVFWEGGDSSFQTNKTLSYTEDKTLKCYIASGTYDNHICKFQLEEGTVATPYEPYIEDKLTILSPVQLEKVGDVRDRIIEKDGVWGIEKNVITITLDGTEAGWYNNDTQKFYEVPIADIVTPNTTVICDKYIHTISGTGNETGKIVTVQHSAIRIYPTNYDNTTLSEFKKELNVNNVTIKYPTTQLQFIPLPHSQQVKLRTFASKTNISFLTEIEGTIKAQVPKSLGATVNTHTEQISNLNKELDRVKKLEENTVSTVTTESDFTTVEATSNGYFEDVKLEGKTLVNLVQNAKEYTLTRESVESGFAQVACDTYILDKNKDYTAIYIQISREGNTPKFSINNVETDNADYYNIALFDTSTTGYEVVIKKINRSYNWQTMRFYYDSEYIGTTKFKLLLLEGDHTQNPLSYFEGLKSVGEDVDEIVVSSNNNQPKQIETTDDNSITTTIDNPNYQSDKKRLLYYNTETQAWEKPILREWDSIEKHTDGKYYYHVRSIEEDYVEGDEIVTDYITDMTTTVKPLSQEKVYECTNIDLITYNGETNFIVESGVLSPKTTLKVHSNISNVVSLLQKKVSLLESNMTKYMITQNRLMLASRYNADTVSFKVDVASFSDTFEYDNDLYELILNNILVGKDNYNREYIENLIRFYWMDFIISDEMYSTLFEIIKEQHNPKIEEEEETPLI